MTSNFTWHCINELKAIGMYGSEEEMNRQMTANIMELCQAFERQGHSGMSANYCIGMFEKLARWEALSPLTGEDDEWVDVSDKSGGTLYQNKRNSRIFKDENGAYDINGKVFIEKYMDVDGVERNSSFTSKDSVVYITFPYTPKTEYVEVDTDGNQ